MGRFLGFLSACAKSFFSYSGVELIGIAAADTERPRQTIPRVARRVATRIVFFYVGAIVALGLNVSSNDPILRAEATGITPPWPFSLLVQRAGIPAMAHVINSVALISALSVANADLYVTVSRLQNVADLRRAELYMPLQVQSRHL